MRTAASGTPIRTNQRRGTGSLAESASTWQMSARSTITPAWACPARKKFCLNGLSIYLLHLFIKEVRRKVPPLNCGDNDQDARDYGLATSYRGVADPSEPNYVAMLGGDFFGIISDNPYWFPGNTVPANSDGSPSNLLMHSRTIPRPCSHVLSWAPIYTDPINRRSISL